MVETASSDASSPQQHLHGSDCTAGSRRSSSPHSDHACPSLFPASSGGCNSDKEVSDTASWLMGTAETCAVSGAHAGQLYLIPRTCCTSASRKSLQVLLS